MHDDLISQAVRLSRSFEQRAGLTPFGALVWRDGEVLATGISSVVADHDPTAHAEVNAIRAAGARVGSHLLPGAILVSSAYPCPLCLMTAVWAGIDEVHYAAGLDASETAGFEDASYYHGLRTGPEELGIRMIAADAPLREDAEDALREWRRRVDDGTWS